MLYYLLCKMKHISSVSSIFLISFSFLFEQQVRNFTVKIHWRPFKKQNILQNLLEVRHSVTTFAIHTIAVTEGVMSCQKTRIVVEQKVQQNDIKNEI